MKWTLGLLFVASVATALPRHEKAFSLFSVVTFPNEECTTKMVPAMSGQCVTAEECTNSGGTAAGNCASAFGVCCFRFVEATQATETVPVNHDLTHIQNFGFPAAVGNAMVAQGGTQTATTLMFPVTADASICQIRLDFVNAVFSPPTAANGGTIGTCRAAAGGDGDALTIATTPAQRFGFNQLCGTLTGQHLYIDTARANPGLTLTIATGTNTFARTWKILVRRISCSDPDMAPPGCRQFHTGLSDRITSLNGGIAGQIMLNNLNYRVCIRAGAGTSGYTVREAGGMVDSFQVVATGTAVGAKSSTGSAAKCPAQFIRIPNAFEANSELLTTAPANAFPPDFCGAFLSPRHDQGAAGVVTALYGFNKDDAITVVSDSAGGVDPTGFDLIYQQF